MDLRELRVILSRYILVAAAAFYLCVTLGVLAAFVPAKVYATTATMVLEISSQSETAGGAVQQASFLQTTLQEKARTRTLKERARADVPEAYRNTRVDITASGQSSILKIRGESTSPLAAEAWVNAVANRLVEEQPRDSAVVLGVLDPAPLRSNPIAPQAEPIILASVVVGLIAGLFAALAADRIKRAFDTAQTVRERLDTTLLGEVPAMRRLTRERRRPMISLLAGENSSSDLVTAFDNIRTNVEFRMTQVGADRVAIVSLNRGAGKSVVTAGLAYSMSNVAPVVAIEADLRRPALGEHLGVRLALGLGDMATFGYEDLFLQPTAQPNLRLLPAGIPVARPADIITSTLPFALQRLSDAGQSVFIDSPPLIGASESAIIVTEAKWVILVMSNSGNDFAGLQEAVQRINDAGGTLLGVVVNRVPRRRFRRQSYSPIGHRRRQLGTENGAPIPTVSQDAPPVGSQAGAS
ncbi:MAG: hypothetical protein AAF547_09715 [Actinomycetota bacterium]